jgi:hypothetical protein
MTWSSCPEKDRMVVQAIVLPETRETAGLDGINKEVKANWSGRPPQGVTGRNRTGREPESYELDPLIPWSVEDSQTVVPTGNPIIMCYALVRLSLASAYVTKMDELRDRFVGEPRRDPNTSETKFPEVLLPRSIDGAGPDYRKIECAGRASESVDA